MHISDIARECSQRCVQLALKCSDEEVAVELNAMAVQLMVAVVRGAELLVDSTPVRRPGSEQSGLSVSALASSKLTPV